MTQNKLNVLVIGSGGREHALAWKISQSPRLNKLYLAPGNGGTYILAINLPLDISNHSAILDACKQYSIDLVVIGPDDVLAAGLADDLRAEGINTFGPSKHAAQIESSKTFAKDIMKQAGVNTASYHEFDDYGKAVKYLNLVTYPVVIKADGLALGKGVIVCQNKQEAQKAIKDMMQEHIFGVAGNKVIIEQFLLGAEISLHAFSDGKDYVMFPSSQDHKPVGEGDTGLNTGGMGTIAPVPWVSQEYVDKLGRQLVKPVLEELKARDSQYSGLLYPGLMLSDDNYNVIEYNARFGDPETQSYMRILKTDILDILEACAVGSLSKIDIKWSDKYACCIVLASGGYPGSYNKGQIITGLDEAEILEGIVVFHAGTKLDGDKLVTNGGRVLGVTAIGQTLDEALEKAYVAVKKIHFEGMQYRTDIGRRPTPDWIK